MASCILFALVAFPCFSSTLGLAVTPVQKVLEMLGEMGVKGQSEMEAEQKIYATYKEWVDDRTQELGFEIETAKSDIEKLLAFIAKADNDVAELGAAIQALDDDIARLEASKKEGTDMRTADHAEYVKIQQDYSESVDALQRAIQILSSQNYDRPQAEALLQKMAVTVPGMSRVLAAFLQQKAHDTPGAPAVAAYEFQSNHLVEMLKGLLEKFSSELNDVETEEANKQHAYELEQLHLGNTIADSKKDREEKSATKAQIAGESAEAKGHLAETKASLAEDERLLAEIQSTFEAKTQAYEANQKVRADELEALHKATEIISSPSVADSYSTHVNLVQVAAQAPSFVQVARAAKRAAAKDRASAYLKRRALSLSSETLAKFVAELASNPFAKVVDMIKTLIARLKEEAAAEADHKAWCDEQLKNNKLKREKKTTQLDKLAAEIEELTGQIDTMAQQIATLIAEQAALTKAMAEATEQRTAEKATNEATIADAQAAIQAVKQALVILREFYSSQASEFLQQGRQVPELAAYNGMQGAKGGVIGMLEVIESDFVRLEADTKAAEAQAASEYSAFMEDAKADKLQKHNREVKLSLDKDQAEFEKSQKEKDHEAVSVELARANEFYEYLKPNCLEVHVSYEERVARRKEEIVALKEAYNILGADSA